MAYEYIDPKYLQSNDNENKTKSIASGDLPDYLKPRKKYYTQEEVAPSGIDWSKINITPGNSTDLETSGHMGDLQRVDSTLSPGPTVQNMSSYDKYKYLNPNTPKWLQPIGYAIESPFRIPFVNRLAGAAAKTAAGEESIAANAPINTYSSNSGKVGNLLADIAGSGLGMTVAPQYQQLGQAGNIGENLLNQGLNKFGVNTGSKLAQYGLTGLRGAGEMGALGGIEANLQGANGQDTLKAIRDNAAMGAAFGLGSKAVGDLSKGAIDLIKNKGVTDYKVMENGKPITPTPSTINENIQTNTLATPTEKVAQNEFKANTDNPTNEVAMSFNNSQSPNISDSGLSFTKDILNTQQMEPDYGQGSGKFKTSEFKSNTLKNAEMLKTPETQKIIDDIKAQYEVKPNEQSIARATIELSNNFDDVVNRIQSLEALNSAEDTAASGLITRSLRQEAEKTNDYSQVKTWLEIVQPKVTATAQSLQAVKTWKDLSPEGVMFKAQQIIGKVNREGEKTYGKNFKPTELTADDLKFIDDTMKKVETAKDDRTKDLEFGKVKKLIADKIPPTLANKISALQRIQLLLNPKTMVRNTVGNIIMGGLENIKDIPGTLADKAISLKTGERTTLLPSIEGLKTQGKGLTKGAKETVQDFKLNVNTAPTRGQFELPETTTFKNPGLNKLEKITNTGLELGDRPFFQAAYDDSLRQQMKIAKVNEPTGAMIEKAKSAAEDRTFQNVSKMVEGFKKLQKGLNSIGSGFGVGNEEFGLGNIVLPFTKTPANILDKAIDYSPLGGIKAIGQLISKKTFDQKLFVDRVGRSITGSAAILLGYDLAKNGLLTGKASSDKDAAALERQAGKSAYAFKVGDTYRTFDWAQPAAIPLAIGADIFHQGKDRKSASNVAIEAIKSGGQTLFQQSLLQGMQKLFGGTDPVSGVSATLQGIPTQFLPGSLSKAITQLKDPYVRDTYDPSAVKTILNQIQAKVPGISEKLPVKIDTMGRETKQYQGKNNPYNVLINPGITTKFDPASGEKLALDIYDKTGDKTQFPRVVDTKITYKDVNNKSQTIQLTPTEKQVFQKYIGDKTNKVYTTYAQSSGFMSMPTEEQVKTLQKELTTIYNEGKNKILEGRGIVAK